MHYGFGASVWQRFMGPRLNSRLVCAPVGECPGPARLLLFRRQIVVKNILRNCGGGLDSRIFFALLRGRFSLPKQGVRLTHCKSCDEVLPPRLRGNLSRDSVLDHFAYPTPSGIRIPGATLATSVRNLIATPCISNCWTSRRPAEPRLWQRSGLR